MTKFKVGDWWRTRGGWYEQIASLNAGLPEYPMSTFSRNYYTNDGKYLTGHGEHPTDLVQKMKPPVWEEDND